MPCMSWPSWLAGSLTAGTPTHWSLLLRKQLRRHHKSSRGCNLNRLKSSNQHFRDCKQMKKQSFGKTSSWLSALFITIFALTLTACSTPTQPKTAPQASLLLECRNPDDITGNDGASALQALTDWGAALRECRELNAAKAEHIRNTSGF